MFYSVQLLSRIQLSDPMHCSMPDFPVLHHLLKLAQTHVHWVGEVIKQSHPVIPFSCLMSFPAEGFSKESVLCIRWLKYWSFSFSTSPSNEYSGLTSSRIDWLNLLAVWGTLKSLLQHHKLESINSSVLSLLYGQTLTSIHDYCKNHSFDFGLLLAKWWFSFLICLVGLSELSFQGASLF